MRVFYTKLRYLYGVSADKLLKPDQVLIEESSRTRGRVKRVYRQTGDGQLELLATAREDGSLAITLALASILKEDPIFSKSFVVVDDESVPFVSKGRSVMAGHVVRVGENVHVGLDVPIVPIDEREVIAVGVFQLPVSLAFRRGAGVVVKVRDYINRYRGGSL